MSEISRDIAVCRQNPDTKRWCGCECSKVERANCAYKQKEKTTKHTASTTTTTTIYAPMRIKEEKKENKEEGKEV